MILSEKEAALLTDYVLSTDALSKRYGKHTVVDKVSLHIRRGAIYGLVGRNGAGKTTFMKMICGFARPASGSYSLFGETYPAVSAARTKVGNLIETPGFFEKMSAYDNLRAKAKLFRQDDKQKLQDILKLVHLDKTGSKPAGKFSLGMLQRLGIGLALIGDPQMLVLDEPINGLDPTGVAEIRETLLSLSRDRGITILISSHILGELSKLATDYGFIEKGSLIREISHDQLQAECTDHVRLSVDDAEAAVRVLNGIGITGVTPENEPGNLRVNGCTERTAEITAALVHGGVGVYEIARQAIDLESYYFQMIGKDGKE